MSMPSSSSFTGAKTYHALPPPKKQIKFDLRRRSVKPSTTLPRLTKDQSTLTQLDFVGTPRNRDEAITISSDEDFEEPQPKKRKRKSRFDERERDQSSLTQMDLSKSTRIVRQTGVDEDGFQIWEDYDPEALTEDVSERQRSRRRDNPWLWDENDDQEYRELQEIPETSRPDTPSSQKAEDRVELAFGTKAMRFETPRKVRFTEVPSSQTPPSSKLSTQSSIRCEDLQRSPLKERSDNILTGRSILRSPESQNVSMRMLERIRLRSIRKVPSEDAMKVAATMNNPVLETDGVEDSEEAEMELQPANLQRVTTIQDSQTEISGSASIEIADGVRQPSWKLLRVKTVQDSQYEDIDFQLDDEVQQYGSHDGNDQDEAEYFEDDAEQATFDPANSALDRDAARFGLTQTQPKQHAIAEQSAEEETDDDDLDRGCAAESLKRNAFVLDDSSQVRDESAEAESQSDQKQSDAVIKDKVLNSESEPHVPEDSAYGSGDLARPQEVEVPSSPPPLWPSQISTVVPTQNSINRPLSRQSNLSSLPQKSTITQLFTTQPPTIPSSPQESYAVWPETVSSSPFPLPPWSSPHRPRYSKDQIDSGANVAKTDVHLESLVDFSLPPPPPLSSSRRQTPASSISRVD